MRTSDLQDEFNLKKAMEHIEEHGFVELRSGDTSKTYTSVKELQKIHDTYIEHHRTGKTHVSNDGKTIHVLVTSGRQKDELIKVSISRYKIFELDNRFVITKTKKEATKLLQVTEYKMRKVVGIAVIADDLMKYKINVVYDGKYGL